MYRCVKNQLPISVILMLISLSCLKIKMDARELEAAQNLVEYVNPLMGTDSKYTLSNGNTYPAIATPWGMNFWTPMTSAMGDGWTYK